MKISVAVLLLALSASAMANPEGDIPPGHLYGDGGAGGNGGNGGNNALTIGDTSSNAAAISTSHSSANAGAVSGAASSATSGDSAAQASSGDSAASLSYTEARQHKAAASTSATVIGNTTASCRAFIGLSAGVVSGGGGIGFPITDGDCKFTTLANNAFAVGNTKLGWELFCRAPTVRKEIGFDACIESSK